MRSRMSSFVGDGGTRFARDRVKWFNDASGYGFITPEGGGEDLFVRQTSVAGEDASLLSAGDRVEYGSREGGMGLEAIDVLRTA
jgi:CspA family cold shock protein